MSENKDTAPEPFRLSAERFGRKEREKELARARKRRYEQAHKEQILAKHRAYYAANLERKRAYGRAYYAANREKILAGKPERRRRQLYGLASERYSELLAECRERCPCCGVPFSEILKQQPRIDHCHRSGRVRGLLCSRCNCLLGHAGDDPMILRACLRYLARVGAEPTGR
jgi:Recombination endonuclease VII